jgi:CBS domain containing-hemolysin-like protein
MSVNFMCRIESRWQYSTYLASNSSSVSSLTFLSSVAPYPSTRPFSLRFFSFLSRLLDFFRRLRSGEGDREREDELERDRVRERDEAGERDRLRERERVSTGGVDLADRQAKEIVSAQQPIGR